MRRIHTGNAQTPRIPTQAGSQLAGNAGALLQNFNGTSSLDSEKTNFGAEFEPPDQGLCVGNGVVVEPVNSAYNIYRTNGTKIAGPFNVNRLFNDAFDRTGEDSNLSAWAPAVDIYETEQELMVKADLPDVDPKDLDIRVENNILTIRGERKFDKKVNEENYLRVERSFGSFARSFTLSNTVDSDGIKAEYQDGVLTLTIPKREEAKPKQIKVNVSAPGVAAAASGK